MDLEVKIRLHRDSGFVLDVDFVAPANAFTALYGPSGSGKTTILRCIAGLERTRASDEILIHYGDHTWHDGGHVVPTHQRGIGYVFQHAPLLPHLTVMENLEYARRRSTTDGTIDIKKISDWLALDELLENYADQMSGGERQRAAIARALVSGSNLILMDEPLGSVDASAKARILPYLDRLHEEISVPIIYVSHALSEITHLADHLILIDNGKVLKAGSVFDLSSQLDLSIAHEESAAAVLSCVIDGHEDRWGLSRLVFDGGTLYVNRQSGPPGTNIRLRIPARDVSIALEAPAASSILNIIPAVVDQIEQTNQSRKLIRLKMSDQYLLARITDKSIDALALSTGQRVYAQIKSVALLADYRED